jgi:predicted  nucleic acid-binding Zn-ribbon protein
MNDIDLIRDLAALDQQLDQLDRDHAQHTHRLTDARAAMEAAKAETAAAAAALADLKDKERAVLREIGSYEKRRATATRALEEGLGDPNAAQRQVDQCSAILDDLETQQLELLEAQEDARDTQSSRAAIEHEAAETLAELEEQIPKKLAEIVAARNALVGPRATVRGHMPHELGARYDLIRAKKRTAVAQLTKDDGCSRCQLRAPTMEAAEVRRDLLKMCRGCGRYLLAVL